MYCGNTMKILLPAMEGEIENYLFLRFQYTANVPVFSDIDGSGPSKSCDVYLFGL